MTLAPVLSSHPPPEEKFLRRASLIVASASDARELAGLQFKFLVHAADVQTLGYAQIRVWNLSEDTVLTLQKPEYSTVILQAGYRNGAYGKIFQGTVVQIKSGKENATDTYLDILARDGDDFVNFAVVKGTLAAGATPKQILGKLITAFTEAGASVGYITDDLPDTALPRGKTFFGMARDGMRQLGAANGFTWVIEKGQIVVLPLSGFRPSESVLVNSQSGMVGIPEQTADGIKVRMLLNPLLNMGCKMTINESDIARAQQDPSATALPVDPNLPGIGRGEGTYRIYSISHFGDTRGNDWYSDVIGLSIDPTVSMGLPPGLASALPNT